jgi:hypothetical protein
MICGFFPIFFDYFTKWPTS